MKKKIRVAFQTKKIRKQKHGPRKGAGGKPKALYVKPKALYVAIDKTAMHEPISVVC